VFKISHTQFSIAEQAVVVFFALAQKLYHLGKEKSGSLKRLRICQRQYSRSVYQEKADFSNRENFPTSGRVGRSFQMLKMSILKILNPIDGEVHDNLLLELF
jgi:hypothetical protein